ncbi:MAG: BMP family ABC transporter substrate-binding protein [Propionibacteriaceae bacterium]|jgi:basic membrane protein A|nr:BMP family ABC transporter substrate-binding protein [Propionibacteriaceae bacterium]
MKHRLAGLGLAAALALAACTSGGDPSKPSIVHVVTSDAGSAAQAGLDRLKAEGYRINYIDSARGDPAAWEADLTQASGDHDIVVAGTADVVASLNRVAQQFPDQHYLLYGATLTANNVTSVWFRQNEGAFLAGVLAGLVTTRPDLFPKAAGSKDVAFVGGDETDEVREYVTGFAAGVHAVDPSIQVQAAYVGGSLDPNTAHEIAEGLYLANGADVVLEAAGSAGAGVRQAAADLGRYAIAVGANYNAEQPGFVLASVVTEVGDGVYRAVTGLADGSVVWGQTLSLGVADAAVGLTFDDNAGAVPEAIQGEITAWAAKVASFEVQVPSALNP